VDGPAAHRTGLGARRSVAEVRAQEDDAGPVVRGVLEVDVRLRGVGLQIAERQLPADLVLRPCDREAKLTCPRRRQGRYLEELPPSPDPGSSPHRR
jgi:hypothetical protein